MTEFWIWVDDDGHLEQIVTEPYSTQLAQPTRSRKRLPGAAGPRAAQPNAISADRTLTPHITR
jgi:hypothetical protein